jgi:hypothetical protein
MHVNTPPMYSVRSGLRDCQTSTLYFCALLKRPEVERARKRSAQRAEKAVVECRTRRVDLTNVEEGVEGDFDYEGTKG